MKLTPLLIFLSALSVPILLTESLVMEQKFVFIFGIFMALVGGKILLVSIASHNWPKTTGVITSTEVVAIKGQSYTVWRVEVKYAYSVNGVQSVGDLVSFKLKPFTNPESAAKFASKFPRHANVSVSYNPHSPDVAVLEPGVKFLTLFFFLSGLLIVIGMIYEISSA